MSANTRITQLTEMHASALTVYGERCSEHFNTLKSDLVKESLTLVDYLMCGSFSASKQKGTHASHSKSS